MDEQKLQAMKPEHRAKMAVAYLMRHRDEIPENLKRFFNKLWQYEDSLKNIVMGMQEAEAALAEFQTQHQLTAGSINAVVGLIAEDLTDENQILEWCRKYEPIPVSPHIAGGSQVARPGPTSMAGATAATQPPPTIIPASAGPVPAQQP